MSYFSLDEQKFLLIKTYIEDTCEHKDFEKLTDWQQEFMRDYRMKLGRYGRSLHASAKQETQLRKCYNKVVTGDTDGDNTAEEDVLDRIDRLNNNDRRRRF